MTNSGGTPQERPEQTTEDAAAEALLVTKGSSEHILQLLLAKEREEGRREGAAEQGKIIRGWMNIVISLLALGVSGIALVVAIFVN